MRLELDKEVFISDCKLAVKFFEFRDFLHNEIKIEWNNIDKLAGCGACWGKLFNSLNPRMVEKIKNYLIKMYENGLILQDGFKTSIGNIITRKFPLNEIGNKLKNWVDTLNLVPESEVQVIKLPEYALVICLVIGT